MTFQVRIGNIVPQRDEFQLKDRVAEDVEFWASREKAVDVKAFKRFRVNCDLVVAQGSFPFEMVLNLRSHFVTVASKGCPVQAEMIAQALVWNLAKFRPLHEFPKLPVVHDQEGSFAFAVADAHWVAAALHDLRERAGFSGEGNLEPRKSPFDKWHPGINP